MRSAPSMLYMSPFLGKTARVPLTVRTPGSADYGAKLFAVLGNLFPAQYRQLGERQVWLTAYQNMYTCGQPISGTQILY